MKRVGNVWEVLCSTDTLREAIIKASRGKKRYRAVREITRDPTTIDSTAVELGKMLREHRFHPAPLVRKWIKTEYGKDREISKTPFYPDCIIHHAIALVIGERWYKALSCDTYACLKERGINCGIRKYNLNRKVKRAIAQYKHRPLYCLKMDIRKCYPSTDNKVLAGIYRKYVKDKDFLNLLDDFNFNCKGLPIGSYLSQLWINIILNELDKFVKHTLGARHYFRYMDDMVILSDCKADLHEWQHRIIAFLRDTLHYEINDKRQVFPIGHDKSERGLDFAGYVYRRNFTLLRKRIKKSFIRRRHNGKSVASYMGMLKYCNSRNLVKEVIEKDNENMRNISELNISIERPFEGDKIGIDAVVGKPIKILNFKIKASEKKPGTDFIMMQIAFEGKKRFLKGGYQYLAAALHVVNFEELPLEATILYKNGYYFDGTILEDVNYDD